MKCEDCELWQVHTKKVRGEVVELNTGTCVHVNHAEGVFATPKITSRDTRCSQGIQKEDNECYYTDNKNGKRNTTNNYVRS